MTNVATPSHFVSTFVKKNKIIDIILALQMAQAHNSSKSKVEIILNISHLNLVPRMAIMFHVHSLHVLKVTIYTNNKGEFKQNISIRCGQNAMNIINAKLIIVQIFQLRTNMRDK
jgi:hypothetical protein